MKIKLANDQLRGKLGRQYFYKGIRNVETIKVSLNNTRNMLLLKSISFSFRISYAANVTQIKFFKKKSKAQQI